MSEPSATSSPANPPRPVGTASAAGEIRAPRAPLVSVLGVLALFLLFAVVVYYVYLPRRTGAFIDDGIRTEAQRRQTLTELRQKEAQQLTNYGWVDQNAGVVQLPLERAMELTLETYGKKQP